MLFVYQLLTLLLKILTNLAQSLGASELFGHANAIQGSRFYFSQWHRVITCEIKIRKINLFFFYCTSWRGRIKAMEGQKFKWVKLRDLKQHNLLSSNQRLLKFIFSSRCLFPACY